MMTSLQKPLSARIKPIRSKGMIDSNSLKNSVKSVLEALSPVRIQALAIIFASATKAMSGWWEPRPCLLGLYPLATPSWFPWRVRTVESRSMVILSSFSWENQKRLMAGNTLSLRSMSNFLKKRVNVLWEPIPFFQPKILCTTLSFRSVPEWAKRVAPKMVLTINPSARSTESYPRFEPGMGKSRFSSLRNAFNPLRRYVSSINLSPPQGDTCLSVKSYAIPFIYRVNQLLLIYTKGNKGLQMLFISKGLVKYTPYVIAPRWQSWHPALFSSYPVVVSTGHHSF